MDYNDNDYEGHNLHLAGEESSKHSSTLRPFVLPKFDFDDNHLRFDSLVDNEVFLGIPSQDDNQWIEDFSRGSSGIQYCSSATVSCALPRCNNVWSEATSSESVEMLLKAVGQEEMIPGENMVNESDLVNQVDSVGQMVTNLIQDDKMDDVDSVNPLLHLSEVEEDSSVLNHSAGIEGVRNDAEDRNLSSYGLSVDNKENSLIATDSNMDSDMSRICEDKGESHDLVNDSLSEQVQERLPVSETGIDNFDSFYQVHDRMLVDQDNIIDTTLVSSGCVSEGIAVGVDEQKEDTNSNDQIFDGNTVQTVISEMQRSPQSSPVTESLNEEHIVEIQVNKSMPETEQSISAVEDCGKVAFDVEPAIDSGCESVISTSISGSKQQSESHSLSHDRSSISFQGEGCADGVGIKGSGDTPKLGADIDQKQVSVTQLSGQPEINAGDEDIYPVNSSSSLEAPLATFESSKPCSPERGPDNLVISSFAGEHVPEESGVECMREPIHTADMQKESLDDGNEETFGEDNLSKQTEGNLSMQADVQGGEHDVSACEKDEKLVIGVHNVVSDDNGKEVEFGVSGEVVEVNVESSTGSQSSASAGDYHVLNAEVEDKKLKSSCSDGEELAECPEHRSPSFGMGYIDQNKELEAAKQPSTSSPMLPSEYVAEVATATKLENKEILDSVGTGGTKTDDPPVSLVEMSNPTMPDEATQELSQKVEYPATDSIVQNDGSETAHTEKIKAKIERSGANSSKVSDSGSAAAETDESNHPGSSSTILTGQGQGVLNKKDSLESDVENVGDALPTCTNSGVNTLSKQEGSFTFDIRPLGGQSTEDPNKSSQQSPRIQAVLSSTGEGSPLTFGSRQKDTVAVKEISQTTSLTPSGGLPSSEVVKGSSDRKPRRRNSKSGTGTKRGDSIKETALPQQTDKSSTFLSPLGAGQLMKFDGSVKPIAGLSVSASSLPDLNTSGPSSAIFRQPFTDLQQVQLRAQIFVYGSLIQGVAPDESCMVSAFDGGRSAWEPSWRAFIEKRNNKQTNKIETPIQSRSGAIASGQTSNHVSSQSEVLSTPIGRTTDKPAPSPLVNPIIPLSTPLWNISTPSSVGQPSSTIPRFDYPVLSPLHPYQTPPIRSFAPHTTTWPSQAPYPVPWLASSKSSPFDIRANYPASPITEPVKLTPIIESSLHVKNHVPHVPAIHTVATSVFTGTPTRVDLKKVTGSTSQMTPSETKTRKRKKSSAVDASQVDNVSTSVIANNLPKKVPAVNALNQVDSVSVVSGRYSIPVPLAFGVASNQIISPVLPSVSSDKRALDPESLSKVGEAKLHAEQAAALATKAVSHCQSVWSKLDQQKNSGLTADAEAKLAAAAVAIAAAASVAKAAAAAAEIACNAAVQAKQIADEAVTLHGTVKMTDFNTNFTSTSGNMTPVSTLAISAARQAARKRVEDASAASKHAENLDAILKAAELAAEAVSHTGKIVGMGDPFSLNELVRAGPDGYWKISHVGPVSGSEPKETNMNNVIAAEVPSVSKNLHVGTDKDFHDSVHAVPPIETENLIDSLENGGNSVKLQKDKSVLNRAEAVGSVSELDIELRSSSFKPYESNASIKEGSAVEVLKDLGKKAWFSANVLSLKDDNALVCYTELHSDEGSEKLKEWVLLQAQGGGAPVIRTARPMTAVQFEGTRKRRRSATKDYDWSVGDRVDAWVKDCWREGIIAEKNKKDPTTLTINFPAEEEILTVKAWHLRPTLIWSDNQWSEYWRQGENDISQGDTPLEKRPKLGTVGIESKGKGKMAKKTGFPEAGTINEQLPLSVKESVFNIGNTNNDNNVRTTRPGLQKEGPRTLFGVPKPGKKRKFMEVSKHYVSERTNKTTTLNESAKSSLPLGFGSRVSKNNPRVDSTEKKQVPESKPRKPPVPTRTLPRTQPNTNTTTSSDRPMNGSFTSNSHDDSESENRKKVAMRSTKPERLNKGKLLPKSGKLAENESGEKSESEVAGPRRSNRRIQPTSRLLEGLQSSLVIPKFPSSHDKGQRSHRGTPKRE